MNTQQLQMISMTGFALAGVFLVIGTVLFVKLNIRGIWGELSGRLAEKQIQELRIQNHQTEDQAIERKVSYAYTPAKSRKLEAEGMVVQEENETMVLRAEAGMESGTMVLEPEAGMESGTMAKGYQLVENEIMIHSNELI